MVGGSQTQAPTGIVIGAGDRGSNVYAPLVKESSLGAIVGVAERSPDVTS